MEDGRARTFDEVAKIFLKQQEVKREIYSRSEHEHGQHPLNVRTREVSYGIVFRREAASRDSRARMRERIK